MLFFEFSGVVLDVVAHSDLNTFTNVIQREQFFELIASIALAKVRGSAI